MTTPEVMGSIHQIMIVLADFLLSKPSNYYTLDNGKALSTLNINH